MSLRRIVVVGNGIAGQTACDTLRTAGFDGELTIAGAENHRTYSRPALSKALLHQDQEVQAHLLPEPRHGATEILGVEAVGLDPQQRVVTLDSGQSLPYDGLIIASGSRARRLARRDGAGTSSPELVLRTLDDAIRLKDQISSKPSVLVIGGGPLGMEVASGALHAGCEVTLVSNGNPLASQLGEHLARFFRDAATAQGLKLICGGRAEIIEQGTSWAVRLADGTVLEADLLVSAVGDEPNVHWLQGTGLLDKGALHTDSRGRIRPEIVAAGDAAAFPTAQGHRRVPLWTSAIDQAKTAALGLLHGDGAKEFASQQYFWTEGFGLSLKVLGQTALTGAPGHSEQGTGENSLLMHWGHEDGSGTAAALNYRIAVPKLRKLASAGPQILSGV